MTNTEEQLKRMVLSSFVNNKDKAYKKINPLWELITDCPQYSAVKSMMFLDLERYERFATGTVSKIVATQIHLKNHE